MSTTITHLPAELLSNIFGKLNKLHDLAECRLVCRAWNDPAERSMLGHTIVITKEEAKMRSLYAFLQTDPTRTNLVKHLNIHHNISLNSTTVVNLLQLVLTPHIESITGDVLNLDTFNLIMEIIKGEESASSIRLNNLKTLALASGNHKPPLELALHCKDTIQTMKLWFYQSNGNGIDWNFLNRLDEFHYLTSFTLAAAVGTIRNLDKILDSCPHLQDLTLVMFNWEYNNEDTHYLEQHTVKRHPSIKTLHIGDGIDSCSSALVEYLLYKSVDLEKISLDIPADDRFDGKAEIVRIPQLIQKVPQRKLLYTVNQGANMQLILVWLKSAGYTITVEDVDERLFDVRIRVES